MTTTPNVAELREMARQATELLVERDRTEKKARAGEGAGEREALARRAAAHRDHLVRAAGAFDDPQSWRTAARAALSPAQLSQAAGLFDDELATRARAAALAGDGAMVAAIAGELERRGSLSPEARAEIVAVVDEADHAPERAAAVREAVETARRVADELAAAAQATT